jgi:hypothetical protein
MISGIVLATIPAVIKPHGISEANCPLKVATPTVIVREDSWFIKVSANMNSFQEKMNIRRNAAVNAGAESGIIILRKL